MKDNAQRAKDNRDHADHLVTSQTREALAQLIEKLASYQDCIDDLFAKLKPIEDAVVKAGEAAKSLLDDDALEALVAIRRLQKATERKKIAFRDLEDFC